MSKVEKSELFICGKSGKFFSLFVSRGYGDLRSSSPEPSQANKKNVNNAQIMTAVVCLADLKSAKHYWA